MVTYSPAEISRMGIRIVLRKEAKRVIAEETRSFARRDLETNGSIFGKVYTKDERGSQILLYEIREATDSGPNAVHNPGHTSTDAEYLNAKSVEAASRGLYGLGNWHSHPTWYVSEPSHMDSDTIRGILSRNPGLPFFIALITRLGKGETAPGMRAFAYSATAERGREVILYVETNDGTYRSNVKKGRN